MARQGKIARLPERIRRRVNQALLDNNTAEDILSWLNPLPEVQRVLAEKFEGLAISPQNLSEWRAGGFAEWREQEGKVAGTRKLAELAVKLAGADGARIAGGAKTIVAGHLLTLLETLAPEDAVELTKAVVSLHNADLKERGMDHAAKTKEREFQLAERARDQRDRELDLAENRVVGRLLELAKTEPFKKILSSGEPDAVQLPLLRELMFGPDRSE